MKQLQLVCPKQIVRTARLRQGKDLAPRITPRDPASRTIRSLEEAYSLAALPGMKVIEVSQKDMGTYLGCGIILKAYNAFDVRANLGSETGTTWQAARDLLSSKDVSMSLYGMTFPVEKVPFVCGLDEFAVTVKEFESINAHLGLAKQSRSCLPGWTYGARQLPWLLKLGFTREQLIMPPIPYKGNPDLVVANFRKKYLSSVVPVLIQIHGVGINGHLELNEPPCDPLRSITRHVKLTGVARIQNMPAFLKPGEPDHGSIFREIASAFGLLSLEEIYAKCISLDTSLKEGRGMPVVLQPFLDEKELRAFLCTWQNEHSTLRRQLENVPTHGFTVGMGDLLNSAALQLLFAAGRSKALAVKKMIEGPVDSRWPASAVQAMPSALVLIDEEASVMLSEREKNFVFSPDDASRTMISEQLGKLH